MNPEAASWDKEYAGGRYRDEPRVAFVADILAAARRAGVTSGLYIGCGNGRNYAPLVRGGLDLTGLDVSAVALRKLSARMPGRRGSLVHGDLSALPDRRGTARAGFPQRPGASRITAATTPVIVDHHPPHSPQVATHDDATWHGQAGTRTGERGAVDRARHPAPMRRASTGQRPHRAPALWPVLPSTMT